MIHAMVGPHHALTLVKGQRKLSANCIQSTVGLYGSPCQYDCTFF